MTRTVNSYTPSREAYALKTLIALLAATVFAALIPLGEAEAKSGTLKFFASSEVSGERIRVDDIARLQGVKDEALKAQIRAIDLGRAPEPMRERTLSRLSIESALKQGGVPDSLRIRFPATIKVARPGQKLSRAEAGRSMHKAIVTHVRSQANSGHTITVEPVTWRSDLLLPAGELTFAARTRTGSALSGLVMFEIQILADNQNVASRHVSARLKAVGSGCRLQQDLKSGEIIEHDDVTEERTEIGSSTVDCQEAIGQSTRGSLRAGTFLRRSSLKAPDLVQRGDRVVIEYEAGVLRITGLGEARNAGARGEWIQVRNNMSGKTIKARVQGAGRVAIQ